MKTTIQKLIIVLALIAGVHQLGAQGTAFTYQGQLQDNGSPANGTYNLEFSLYNSQSPGGSQFGSTITTNGVFVTNGLFTVTVDFGAGIFIGTPYWMQIGVETNGAASFTALSLRQQLTPAPYAIYGENAGTAATANGVAAGSVTGGGIASGSVVKSLNGLQDLVTLSAGANITLTPSGNGIQISAGTASGTPLDTPLTLVSRDGTGSFAAGTLTLAGDLNLPPTSSSTIGVLELGSTPILHGYGNQNIFVGPGAGNFTMTGVDNAAMGFDALSSDTTGNFNTANGVLALWFNTTGNANTANGYEALLFNTTGSTNTATGYYALRANTTGFWNTADGYGALQNNTTGIGNVANGYQALGYSTTDSQLVAVGDQALEDWNSAGGGYISGVSSEHTAIGYQALQSTTSGVDDTATGYKALLLNTSGSWNTADGAGALYYNASGTENTAVGFEALYSSTTGSQNTGIGLGALYSNTTGYDNTASGWDALYLNTTGYYNTAYGAGALYDNTTGQGNTAIGLNALSSNTNGIYNTASGWDALYSNAGGIWNTADGAGALYANTSGIRNTGDGDDALEANTTGFDNTAIGYGALQNNKGGYANAGIGDETLLDNITGAYNIAVGFEAGDQITGNYNIDIGNAGVAGESGIIRIGTNGVQTACYLAGTVYANGTFVSSSDRNAKNNIQPIDTRQILEKVAAMPVSRWNYKHNDPSAHIGPMAQDFYAAFNVGPDDKHITTIDEGGVALAAIQGLNQKLDETQQAVKAKDGEIQALKTQNDLLAERLHDLEAIVKQLATQK